MTRDKQIAALRAESRKLMHSRPSAAPPRDEQPVREVPLPEPEDPMDRWRREADESDRERAAARAALRREEQDLARSQSAVARIASLERRIAELEQSVATSDAVMKELAAGAEAFARAVNEGLLRMETKLTELGTKMLELRSLDDQRRGSVIDMPSPLRARSVS
jgi:hypothetical protein